MTVTPHGYQLKGAAQMHAAYEGKFRGLLSGDGLGFGKSLRAAMAIHDLWRQIKKPIKRLVLDGCQIVR